MAGQERKAKEMTISWEKPQGMGVGVREAGPDPTASYWARKRNGPMAPPQKKKKGQELGLKGAL